MRVRFLALVLMVVAIVAAGCQAQHPPARVALGTAPPPLVGAAAPAATQSAAAVIAPKSPTATQASASGYQLQKVFFATDRQRTGTSPLSYGGNAGEMTYGYCFVSIPRDHAMGEIETPTLWKLSMKADPVKHMLLMEAENLPEALFFGDIHTTLQLNAKRKTFIFVHGYNVLFNDAVKRVAQMAYDLKFAGAPILYSWPSKGETLAYMADEESAQETQIHLEKFIADVAEKAGADEIYIIAHSMGNRPVTRALASLSMQKNTLKSRIKEILLAAPDIDAKVFREEIAPGLLSYYRNRITVYMSDKDKALLASGKIHRNYRLGQTGGYTAIDGVEMIDATPIDTDFLSHSYFAQKPALISDMFYLMEMNIPPSQRSGLRQVVKQQQKLYWQFAIQQ